MGYNIHITRKSEWSAEGGPYITPDEWLAVLDGDAALARAHDTGGDTLAGSWNGDTLFYFDRGEVTCKNPAEPIIRKMIEIAGQLGASVQGDDGECYPDAFRQPVTPRKSLWRRLFGRT